MDSVLGMEMGLVLRVKQRLLQSTEPAGAFIRRVWTLPAQDLLGLIVLIETLCRT